MTMTNNRTKVEAAAETIVDLLPSRSMPVIRAARSVALAMLVAESNHGAEAWADTLDVNVRNTIHARKARDDSYRWTYAKQDYDRITEEDS